VIRLQLDNRIGRKERAPDGMTWYFAYGSNLDMFQMMRRIGEWETSLRARALGYKLLFNVRSRRWGDFAANIQRTGNDSDVVLGVVYRISKDKLRILENYENIRPSTIDVQLDNGSPLVGVSVFIFGTNRASGKPQAAYKSAILDGLKQHGFSEDDQEKVRSIMEQAG